MGTIIIGFLIIANVVLLPTLQARICSDNVVQGLLVTVFTPVDSDGNIKVDVIPQYAQYLIDNQVDGVIVAATWGEGPTLNVSENKLLLDAWMAAGPRLGLYVVSDIGATPLPDTLEMAAYSEEIGVDALMVLPEVYYKPQNAEELVYYLRFVYEAARNTPLIYDDFPDYSLVYVDMEEFFDLASEEIPTFAGVKSNVFETVLLLQNKVRDDQRIYVSGFLAPAVYLGFDSFVVDELNYAPDQVIDIVNNAQQGNLEESRSQYSSLQELTQAISEEGDIIAAEKEATSLITGINLGPVRPPLIPLTPEQRASLMQTLEDFDLPVNGYEVDE